MMFAGRVGPWGQAELPIHLLQISACLGLQVLTVQGEHMVHLLPGTQGQLDMAAVAQLVRFSAGAESPRLDPKENQPHKFIAGLLHIIRSIQFGASVKGQLAARSNCVLL